MKNTTIALTNPVKRCDSKLAHVDEAWKRATIPILYGSVGALSNTTCFKTEKFGFIQEDLRMGRITM